MATISEVKLWADVGYMEGDVEIPKIGASLPTPTLTVEGPFNPSKGRLFSQIQIPENFYDLQNMSYIGITLIINNGASTQIYKYIYGWIDSVIMLSDNAQSPMCEINWHVDYWRTYASQMTFKGGLVKRSPFSSFPQTAAMTTWTVNDDSVVHFQGDYFYETSGLTQTPVYWLYISYIESSTVGSKTFTNCKFYCTPLFNDTRYITYSGTQYQLIQLSSLIGGTWEELLGLDPSKIKGAWILPLSPSTLYGQGTKDDPFTMTGWTPYKSADANLYGLFRTFSTTAEPYSFIMYEAEILNGAMTTDTTKYIITGFDGEEVGTLPWGIYVTMIFYRVVMSANSCYMQIRVSLNSHAEGTCFTIPAIVVDTIENAYSTYNYTGQREYDMTMKQIGVYQQAAGIAPQALGGAISGASSGGGAYGAAAGGIVGAGTGALSAILSQTLFNPMIQEAQDALVSKQSSGLLISGASVMDTLYHGRCPRLVKMIADSPSIQRRSSVIGRYGYTTNTAYDSCQSLITSGGPLQISNLSIRGNVPVEAKQYVKALFERGVKIT